jgi:hypothetical protein
VSKNLISLGAPEASILRKILLAYITRDISPTVQIDYRSDTHCTASVTGAMPAPVTAKLQRPLSLQKPFQTPPLIISRSTAHLATRARAPSRVHVVDISSRATVQEALPIVE